LATAARPIPWICSSSPCSRCARSLTARGYDVLGYAALATRIYLRYRELLAQAGAPAPAAPGGKEPPQ